MRRIVLDLEANNLLNNESIDYTSSPYKLKDNFKVWCVCCIDLDTGEEFTFVQEEVKTKLPAFLKEAKQITAHNGIAYDLLVLSLYIDFSFKIEEYPKQSLPDMIYGHRGHIEDTLVLSKVQNPDRYQGHSLAVWGERLGEPKTDWRAEAISLGIIEKDAPKGAEFLQWHPRMLDYCLQDCKVTVKLSRYLELERGAWDWADAISLEKYVAWVISRQEHRGFDYDLELGKACVKELDELKEAIQQKVEPHLPKKPIGKTKAKDFIPPKKQFLKNGEVRVQVLDWITNHGGKYWQEDGCWKASLFDKEYTLPLPDECLCPEIPTTLKDSPFIKAYLLSMGWIPTNWKERDLTVDTKKQKLSRDKFEATCLRYVESTLNTPFEKERCEHLNVTPDNLLIRLLSHDITKPLKVLTSPSYTVGQDKELCKGLIALQDKFPFAQDIANFLTYNHRRNSILGGDSEIEDFEDDDKEVHKGFLAYIRDDGRISTPADSCGCATSRMKHKQVCNTPRNSSLYGEKMRAQFGAGSNYYLIGYDADGLENRIKAECVYDYEGGPEYGKILCNPKPHDIHWYNQQFIQKETGIEISRDNTKSTAYALDYGAQPPKLAKTLSWPLTLAQQVFNAYWKGAKPLLAMKEAEINYWKTTGQRKFIKGLDGRKIPVRSQHSIVNYKFQSGGLIAMKRAMMIHHKWLEAEGLLVDFFKDDWKNKKFAQQLIAMHDEAQIEVSKELVKFKTFNTKEEAIAFKAEHEARTGQILSSVGYTKDKYYVAYSRVGELASKAVEEASNYYNMRVKLSAGYSVALRWSDTH